MRMKIQTQNEIDRDSAAGAAASAAASREPTIKTIVKSGAATPTASMLISRF